MFTDTICPHCGRAYAYITERTDTSESLCPYPQCPSQPAAADLLWRGNRAMYNPSNVLHNAQVGADEAAAVAVHPETGEVVYCFTDPRNPMPSRYAEQGFVKQQFHSGRQLEAWCKARGLVNDMSYGNKHDGAFEESQKKKSVLEAERRERQAEYQRAREEVKKSMR